MNSFQDDNKCQIITPFTKCNLEDIKANLKTLGFKHNGYEYMYCAMTGLKNKTEIFIGATYYQRLQHMPNKPQ